MSLPLEDNIIARYDATDPNGVGNGGTQMTDLSGNGHHFTINNGTHVEGATNEDNYFDFNSTNKVAKYLVGGNITDLPSNDNVTIIFFTEIYSNNIDYRTLIRSSTGSVTYITIEDSSQTIGGWDNINNFSASTLTDIRNIPSVNSAFNMLAFKLSTSSPQFQMKYNLNDTYYTISGVSQLAYNNGFSSIGGVDNNSSSMDNASQFWGKIKRVIYYNQFLTDNQINQIYRIYKYNYLPMPLNNVKLSDVRSTYNIRDVARQNGLVCDTTGEVSGTTNYFADNLNFFNDAIFTRTVTDVIDEPLRSDTISWSTRWSGYFEPAIGGQYKFKTRSDDSSLVYIGPTDMPIDHFNKMIQVGSYNNSSALPYLYVDNSGSHGPKNEESVATDFIAGISYPISIYYGNYGNVGSSEMIFYHSRVNGNNDTSYTTNLNDGQFKTNLDLNKMSSYYNITKPASVNLTTTDISVQVYTNIGLYKSVSYSNFYTGNNLSTFSANISYVTDLTEETYGTQSGQIYIQESSEYPKRCIRWSGYFKPNYSTGYTFTLRSDDFSLMYLGSTDQTVESFISIIEGGVYNRAEALPYLIVNNFGNNSNGQHAYATVANTIDYPLNTNETYPILFYYGNIIKQYEIGRYNFSHENTAYADTNYFNDGQFLKTRDATTVLTPFTNATYNRGSLSMSTFRNSDYYTPAISVTSTVTDVNLSCSASGLISGGVSSTDIGTIAINLDNNLINSYDHQKPVIYSVNSGTIPTNFYLTDNVFGGDGIITPFTDTTGVQILGTNYLGHSNIFTFTFDIVGPGQQEFTTPGTFTFTVPVGVTTISAVVIGGGGGGAYVNSATYGPGGAGGGGLTYAIAIDVTPGETLTCIVASGGAGSTSQNTPGGTGGTSEISRGSSQLIYAVGGGGSTGYNTNGSGGGGGVGYGTHASGGGIGGHGGLGNTVISSPAAGGGGAAGYSGNGGSGVSYIGNTTGCTGSGGGGGGGNRSTNDFTSGAGGGGGVGIYGEGASGAYGNTTKVGGDGGSGGTNGTDGDVSGGGNGGLYGGGGGSSFISSPGGDGGGGAVRIIWGPARAYPSTNTHDM